MRPALSPHHGEVKAAYPQRRNSFPKGSDGMTLEASRARPLAVSAALRTQDRRLALFFEVRSISRPTPIGIRRKTDSILVLADW